MQACLFFTTLVGLTLAQVFAAPAAPAPAPAPTPAWRPSGRLILLPARIEESPQSATNNTQAPQESQSGRLLDSGEYYVLLPNGRLQMVKYTTAALTENTANTENTDTKGQLVQEPFAQFQIEYFQFPQASEGQKKAEEQKKEEVKEEASGFEANVEYRDVKPISSPIYAYNPAPLVRVL